MRPLKLPLPLLATTVLVAPLSARAGDTSSGYELKYHFEQNAAMPLHTFVLKWASADSNLQTIDVLAANSRQVLQTLKIPGDKVHLMWKDIIAKPGSTKDRIVDLIDFNFDKFADLRLVKSWPYTPGDKSYMVWLYNDKVNRYEYSELLSALPSPVVDPKTQRISSIKLTGYAGGEYEEQVFSVDGAGATLKLLLQLKITQTALDPIKLSFTREVSARQQGEVRRICQFKIPAEGAPSRSYGEGKTCAPYLVKGPPTFMHKPAAKDNDEKDEKDEKGEKDGEVPAAPGDKSLVKSSKTDLFSP